MRRLLVQRRHWLDEEQFFEFFAACQLIPGPSSTELAVLLGYRRAGWRGLVVGAVCFITPAFALMLLFAALYQRFGAGSVAQHVLAGVTPVVVGIVVWAVMDLGGRVLRGWDAAIVFTAVAAFAVFVNQPIGLRAAIRGCDDAAGHAALAAFGSRARGGRRGRGRVDRLLRAPKRDGVRGL